MTETPRRSIRIPESIWKKAIAKSKREHTNVSAVILQLLAKWVAE